MKGPPTHSVAARDAARLLGRQIRVARRERRWTVVEVADRVGVSPVTLRKVETGDPTVALGTAFEAAVVVGVPLFGPDPDRRAGEGRRLDDHLALLPTRGRQRRARDDDF